MKPIEIKLTISPELAESQKKVTAAFAAVSVKLIECAKVMSEVEYWGLAEYFLNLSDLCLKPPAIPNFLPLREPDQKPIEERITQL
jgi:hypothetical protein